jgi:hypothetical protein
MNVRTLRGNPPSTHRVCQQKPEYRSPGGCYQADLQAGLVCIDNVPYSEESNDVFKSEITGTGLETANEYRYRRQEQEDDGK